MAKSKRRKSSLAAVAMLVLMGLFLASCGGSGEPTEYNQTVEDNYVKGCEVSIDESDSLSGDARAVCQCAYDEIEANIDFEDFKSVDDALRGNIDALDRAGDDENVDKIRGYVRDCITQNSRPQNSRPVSSAEPTEYNLTVEANYVRGCEASIDELNSLSGDARAVCRCAYDEIEENIDFEDFKSVDDALKEDIDALERISDDQNVDKIRGYVSDCFTQNFRPVS